MEYFIHILILVAIFAALAASLDLLVGIAGILSLAHAAFFAIGAYTSAIFSVEYHVAIIPSVFIAVLFGALFGFVIGMLAARIPRDTFVLGTFAFQIIVSSVLLNWVRVTGGPMGIRVSARPLLWGTPNVGLIALLATAVSICSIVFFIHQRVKAASFGRNLRAIREDETLVNSAGKSVGNLKMIVFILSSSLAAAVGAFYAHYIKFIDPTSFSLMDSIFIVSVVIVGGAGSLWGPVLGAVVLITLPELLRFVGIPSAAAANIRQILYGLALVACMLWRPQGLIGEYTFGRKAKQK